MQIVFLTYIFTRTYPNYNGCFQEHKLMTMSDKRSLISKGFEVNLQSSELAGKFKISRFVHKDKKSLPYIFFESSS